MTQHVDEVARELCKANVNAYGLDIPPALARAAMRAVVKQMRELSKRCCSPADQLSIGDAAQTMLDAYAREAGIDE